MINSANGIQWQIKVKGQKLSFKYLAAIVSDEGSKLEVSQGMNKPLNISQS